MEPAGVKTAVRIAASVAIVAAAAAAVARLCWQPWLCNREEARIAARIAKMLEFPGALSVRIGARQDLEAIERCIRADPTVVNRYMLKAALLRIVQRRSEAIETYRDALRVDRRPELWFLLGQTQLEEHRVEPAIENLMITAVLSVHLVYAIPEPHYPVKL